MNVRDYIRVKLHTTSTTALTAIVDPFFKHYSIIDEIASLLDGGREAIERRFKLYENSKCKNKI